MQTKYISAALLAFTLAALSAMSVAQSPNPKQQKIPKFAPDRVLVKFKPGSAASAIGEAHRQARGQTIRSISGIGVQVVQVPSGMVPAKVALYRANRCLST